MNRYDSYKDSGVEWIGEIPSGWGIGKSSHYIKFKKGKSVSENELEYSYSVEVQPYLRTIDVYENSTISKPKRFVRDFEGVYKRDGQYIICFDGYNDVLGKGTLGLHYNKKSGYISGELHLISSKSKLLSDRFCEYSVGNNSNLQVIVSESYGTTVKHSQHSKGKLYVCIPPLSEQHQIVEFLDNKTSSIDSLIQSKEKKIELLKEKRTSLINEVVTKGLNPDVEMKDSGVEWIGEIPREWDLKRLKFLCSITTGNKDTKDRVDDGIYPFFVRSPIVERINSFSYDGESVLTVGDGVGTGKVFHYINGKFDFHQRVYMFSDFIGVSGKYFFWYMKNNFIYVSEDQNSKSTVDSLRLPLIQNFTFCIPPLSEQHQIVEYLDKETKLIDETISSEQKKIELLKEYKQSLISEVVTGKRKVVN